MYCPTLVPQTLGKELSFIPRHGIATEQMSPVLFVLGEFLRHMKTSRRLVPSGYKQRNNMIKTDHSKSSRSLGGKTLSGDCGCSSLGQALA